MNKEFVNQLGADEVGVGDYFGGIVTCACYVNKKMFTQLQSLNIKDSKQLSNLKIIEIAKVLIKTVPYVVKNITAEEYNALFALYKNAHVVKTYAHNYCLSALQTKITSEKYITVLDQYADRNNYEKYLKIIQPLKVASINLFQTKAENDFVAVAAASIIARYYFLKQITMLSKKYRVIFPLGYNKALIKQTLEQLKLKLPETFEQEKKFFLKLHFKLNLN